MDKQKTDAATGSIEASRENITLLADALGWSQVEYERALALAGSKPSAASFLRRTISMAQINGVLFILAGIALFFAFNWASMSHYMKLGLLQCAVIGAVVFAAVAGLRSTFGKFALFSASFLTGVFLAIIGQTYQTGADPYELFLAWAALITPWVIVGRQAALWLLWMCLINLTLLLYWTEIIAPSNDQISIFGPLFALMFSTANTTLALFLSVLNAVFLLAWEVCTSPKRQWMQVSWLRRTLSWLIIFSLTLPTLLLVLGTAWRTTDATTVYVIPMYLISNALLLWFYQTRRIDIVVLALVALSAILVFNAALARVIGGSAATLLFMALLLVGQMALLSNWLKQVHQKSKTAQEGAPHDN